MLAVSVSGSFQKKYSDNNEFGTISFGHTVYTPSLTESKILLSHFREAFKKNHLRGGSGPNQHSYKDVLFGAFAHF